MENEEKVPEYVKIYINNIKKELAAEQTSTPLTTTSNTFNFSEGSSSIVSYGNNNSINSVTNDQFSSPSPMPQQQQEQSQQPQKQEERDEHEEQAPNSTGYREHASINLSDINVSYPSSIDRFYVDGFDITLALYKLNQHVLDHATENKLYWESHVHHLQSLSSILLVTPGRMHKDVRRILGDDGVDALQIYLAARFGSDDCEFSMDLSFKLHSIVKKVEKGKLDRDDTVMELLSLKHCANNLEFKVVKSIRTMIECLPDAVVNDNPNELELLSRYLNTILLPLFDDPKNGILFRWHDTMNHEAHKASASISRRRPDSSISVLGGYSIDHTRGFGEVKGGAHHNNSAALGKDLVRLGFFAKNAIEISTLTMYLDISGSRHITFYLMKLMGDGLYIMYELRSIVAPGSIHQVLDLLGHLDDLLFILYVYDTFCHPMSPEQVENAKTMTRRTLTTPEFDRILDKTVCNKRPCITKRSH